jgi:hypothetical protein
MCDIVVVRKLLCLKLGGRGRVPHALIGGLAASFLVLGVLGCAPGEQRGKRPEEPDEARDGAVAAPDRRRVSPADSQPQPADVRVPIAEDALRTADTAAPDSAPDGGAIDALQADAGVAPADAAPALRQPSAILPVLWIEVGGKTIPLRQKISGRIKIIEDHDGTLKGLGSRPVALQAPIGIGVRGSSSAYFPKKSYSLELRDDAGNDKSFPVLGMPAESDWVLHSCYADKTCMRNALAYAIGSELGRYSPRTRYVEVFLDGRYNGMYLLVEKIKRDKYRVPLPKPAADAASGDLTGGYIIKIESGGDGTPSDAVPRDWVSRESPRVYTYHYPRYNRITSAQKAYIQDHMRKFEQMMKGSAWADPAQGYRTWLEVPSWVDVALVQELANNVDAYHKSVFIQKQPKAAGNKLVLGPLWDFDIAFGNADFRQAHRTDTWAHDMNRFGTAPTPYNPPGSVTRVPFWWEKMWKHPAFQRDLKCRWRELRKGPLSRESIEAKLSFFGKELALAQPRDQALWKTIGVKTTFNYYVGKTYADDVRYLRDWIGKRLAWIDANLPGSCSN